MTTSRLKQQKGFDILSMLSRKCQSVCGNGYRENCAQCFTNSP